MKSPNSEGRGTYGRPPEMIFHHGYEKEEVGWLKFLKEQRKEGKKIREIDIKKTKELCEVVDEANALVAKKMGTLGYDNVPPIDSARFHFVSDETWSEDFGDESWAGMARVIPMSASLKIYDSFAERFEEFEAHDWSGLYENAEDELRKELEMEACEKVEAAIGSSPDEETSSEEEMEAYWKKNEAWVEMYVEQQRVERKSYLETQTDERLEVIERAKKIILLDTTVHEALHLVGYQKFKVGKPPEGHENSDFSSYGYVRSGYHYESVSDEGKAHFSSFNEAVVEQMTEEVMREEFHLIENALAKTDFVLSSDGEKERYFDQDLLIQYSELIGFAYKRDRELLYVIIAGMAEKTEQTKKQVWEKVMRGYFAGNMVFLRDVDRYFGEGALKLLAHIEPRHYEQSALADDIMEYFRKGDTEAKERRALYDSVMKRINAPVEVANR